MPLPSFRKKSDLAESEARIAKLSRERDRLCVQRERVLAEQNSAEAALDEVNAQVDDNPRRQAAAEQRLSVARFNLESIDRLLAKADVALAEENVRVVAERDALARAESVAVFNKQIAAYERTLGVIEGLKTHAAAAAELRDSSFDLGRISDYALNAATELEWAIPPALADLRRIVAGVSSGELPIPLRGKNQPALVAAPPSPPTERIFTIKSIAWSDEEGKINRARGFNDIDLPPALAARAISLGAATTLDDPRRKKLRGMLAGAGEPLLEKCVPLNDIGELAKDEPSAEASPPIFEPLDHVPRAPFLLTSSTSEPLDLSAARNMPAAVRPKE